MKKTVFRMAAVSCLAFASGAPMAWADDGMMHPGGIMHQGGFGRMFDEMDANHDGVVTKKEFDAFHAQRFKELDANHDGKITREEMEAAHQMMMGQAREQFKKRFDEADANHDGALSKEEAKKMPYVAQHFDEIDVNHDGKVTFEELEAAHGQMHGQMHGQGGMMHPGGMCDGMHGDAAHCGGAASGVPGRMMHQDGGMNPGGMK